MGTDGKNIEEVTKHGSNDAETKNMIDVGTIKWEDAELLKQEINRLRKGLSAIDILDEKEENV